METVGTLRGLAVVAVVLGHAAGYGITALAWWGPQLDNRASLPDWGWLGSSDYFGLVGVTQLALASVPMFLFASGFYVDYATRGDAANLTWRTLWGWLTSLLYPCLVWLSISIALGVPFLFRGSTEAGSAFMSLAQRRVADYYYVLVLGQLFLLAPLLVRLAFRHPVWALLLSGLAQAAYSGSHYTRYFGVPTPLFLTWLDLWGSPLPWHWGFFFVLGVVVSRHRQSLRGWLGSQRGALIVVAAALWILSIVETHWLNNSGAGFAGIDDWKLSPSLYASAAVLALFAYQPTRGPLVGLLNRLGTRSYGIYLIQPIAIELTAKTIYHAAPQLLPIQPLFQPILVAAGIGGPLLLMALAGRSGLRRYQRYIFGSSAGFRPGFAGTPVAPSPGGRSHQPVTQ